MRDATANETTLVASRDEIQAPGVAPISLLINDLNRHFDPLRDRLTAAMDRVLGRSWFVLGEEGRAFEHDFAAYCGASHGIGVASGTDALELALRSVGVEAGSTVLTVANAGGYSTHAITAIGARPVYLDVREDTQLMDLDALEDCVSTDPRPTAILATHLYGQPLDMLRICDLAQRYGVPVVEDCAQAHGAMSGGRRCGSYGDASAFSFYPTKNLGAIGDGGMVVTSSAQRDTVLRELRQYGWSKKYVATRSGGRNSRLDELQSAVLGELLPELDAWNARRLEIVRRYRREIDHPNIELPHRPEDGDVGHLFVLRAADRGGLRRHLNAAGIGCDVHYPVPDHHQAAFGVSNPLPLPVTERLCSTVLSLPCFPEMTEAEVSRVVTEVNRWPVSIP